MMTGPSCDAASGLLDELLRAGLMVMNVGGRLLIRPRRRLTPELAERIRAHRDELLELLRPPEVPPGLRTERWPGPEVVVGLPREVVELARERPGWTPLSWAGRLRQLAERCGDLHPDRADALRRAAHVIERMNDGESGE